MAVEKVISVFSGMPIRLTQERWMHIVEEHPELENSRAEVLLTIEKPHKIFEGRDGELLAVREIEPGKLLVVIYKETLPEGFIITAFFTRRLRSIERKKLIWKR